MGKKISGILKETMSGLKVREKSQKDFDLLMDVSGEKWSSYFMYLDYKRGVLKVGVETNSVLQEVDQFFKDEWVSQMKEKGSQVKEIKFKLVESLGD